MLRGIKPYLIKKKFKQNFRNFERKRHHYSSSRYAISGSIGNEYKKKFDKIYPELAEKHQISFLPFLLDGVALNTELNLSDGKHPNQKGIKIISKNLEKKLTSLLHN